MHTHISASNSPLLMSHVTLVNEAYHTCECVMSQMMSYTTHANKSKLQTHIYSFLGVS